MAQCVICTPSLPCHDKRKAQHAHVSHDATVIACRRLMSDHAEVVDRCVSGDLLYWNPGPQVSAPKLEPHHFTALEHTQIVRTLPTLQQDTPRNACRKATRSSFHTGMSSSLSAWVPDLNRHLVHTLTDTSVVCLLCASWANSPKPLVGLRQQSININ